MLMVEEARNEWSDLNIKGRSTNWWMGWERKGEVQGRSQGWWGKWRKGGTIYCGEDVGGLREENPVFEVPRSHLSGEKQRYKTMPCVNLTFSGWEHEAEPANETEEEWQYENNGSRDLAAKWGQCFKEEWVFVSKATDKLSWELMVWIWHSRWLWRVCWKWHWGVLEMTLSTREWGEKLEVKSRDNSQEVLL